MEDLQAIISFRIDAQKSTLLGTMSDLIPSKCLVISV